MTGIIFDLDGTLLDTLQDLTDAVNYTLRYYGCPERTIDEVKEFIGTGAKNLIRKALPGLPGDPELDVALATYQAYYATHARIKTRPFDGILEALAEIGAKYPIAIVSNKPDIAVKSLCAEFFGSHIFALGETADIPRKPAPDMVYKAMAAIGVEQCIYVGDSEPDVEVAKNVGCKALSVLWGFRDEACLRSVGAEYFCRDPKDLLRVLESMM
jgi:phosphoglycolate phosphatase